SMRPIGGEWHRFWSNDKESMLVPQRVHGRISAGEETSAGVQPGLWTQLPESRRAMEVEIPANRASGLRARSWVPVEVMSDGRYRSMVEKFYLLAVNSSPNELKSLVFALSPEDAVALSLAKDVGGIVITPVGLTGMAHVGISEKMFFDLLTYAPGMSTS